MNRVWKQRQRSAYEAMWRDAERKRRRERLVAGPLGWIVEGPGYQTISIVVFVLIFLISAACVVRALAAPNKPEQWREYRVPDECKALAEREGLKNLLTHDEAFAAWLKLNRYSWWPGVGGCLKAVNKTWRFR